MSDRKGVMAMPADVLYTAARVRHLALSARPGEYPDNPLIETAEPAGGDSEGEDPNDQLPRD
jgi:hypothetical protein